MLRYYITILTAGGAGALEIACAPTIEQTKTPRQQSHSTFGQLVVLSFFVFVSRKKLVQKYAIKMACVDTMFIPNESPPFPERAAA